MSELPQTKTGDSGSSLTPSTSDIPSPEGTVVDVDAVCKEKQLGKQSIDEPSPPSTKFEVQLEAQSQGEGNLTKLSPSRKWFLLLVFSVAQYLDVCSVSALFVLTDAIQKNLDIQYEASSWIITSYSVTFASFLLFWGRVADLYSAKAVFAYGFLGLGALNLIISFMPNQYAYFIFRALSGIAGAATIPSAFRLILALFEPQELNLALTIFGLSGAIANVTGLVIAGFFGFITANDQQAGWRWFFRMMAIVIVPFGVSALALIPKTAGDLSDRLSPRDKLKRLDIVGCFMMLVSVILLILGITLGASYGWKKPGFLVPFLLCWPIFVAFFIYEARLSEGYALIPPSFWKIPNMTLLIVFALGIYPWWCVSQLPLVERFIDYFNEPAIIAALRVFPQGASALIVAFFVPQLLQKVGSPRIPIAGGMIIGAAMYLLIIFNDGKLGSDYWRWLFPAFLIGSGAAMISFLATNITVMTSVPPEISGVAGAMLQVALQVGAAISLTVQAGLLTLNPGGMTNYANVQASLWFQFGWLLLNALMIIVLFRRSKMPKLSEEEEAAAAFGA
ncbi:efflux protein EncT [Cryptococcus gattii EJB2]|uniref:Efflux protein EncT n=1 Tax=Cryptococcus gattii EJB2 TaxID=1296103 RepID=A0ABR5BUD0_9TREE|nr:efflux protein EncT [Cryptococcus gattii EJB2]